jgi:hypothetical protein
MAKQACTESSSKLATMSNFVKNGSGEHHVVGTKCAFILLLAIGRYLGLGGLQIDVARMDVTAQSDHANVHFFVR